MENTIDPPVIDNPIERAVQICGGSQADLAAKVGVGQSAVSQWKLGIIAVDVRHYPAIERATDGAVTSAQLLQFELDRQAARKAS